MSYEMGAAGEFRIKKFIEGIGCVLKSKQQQASFALYAMGLLGDGERKSMEPIASRATADPEKIDATHQRLGYFLTDAQWSDRAVRREAARYTISEMTAENPVDSWIIDDTGFLKQGKHSVGVQRQYSGSAGKVTNCQVGVSLSVATRSEHLPIDFELYLPQSWTDDAARREEARIPEEVTFKTKPELALAMINRALEDAVPPGVVLADEGYGNSGEFRRGLRELGLSYAVAVNATTTVWITDRKGGLGRAKWSVREIAEILGPKRFRQTTWRQGTRGTLHARFAAKRVVVDDLPSDQEQVWLLMEWRDDEAKPEHFYLIALPKNISRKKLVRIVKQRWRTERVYEDFKGELGLDHYEGRRFTGWHHHVSVALCCYAFITAEKVRAFSPSARGTRRSPKDSRASRAALSRLLHHHQAGDCQSPHLLAPSMSALSWAQKDAACSKLTDFTISTEMTQ